MKNLRNRVLGVALLLALLLTGCQQADSTPKPAETVVTAEKVKQPMFTNPEQARQKIEEICGIYLYPEQTEPSSYESFMALCEEGREALAAEETDRFCELAEELFRAYKDVDYLRGDVPRVYLNTYIPTTVYTKGCQVTADSEPSDENTAAMASDGDSKTYWLSDDQEQHTLIFDMGQLREIGYICAEWGKGAAKHYEIDVSGDGEVWETVRVIEDGAKYKTQGFTLDTPVEGRYIRLRTLTASSLPYQLEEITAAEKKPERAEALTAEYSEANVVIVDREGGEYPTIAETVRVKIRGNSTANTVKNPYNIKFENKKTVLGMKGTRKWSLIANLFDKSLIRNKLASDFAAMAGVNPALESTFVEVYLDSEYKGCYLLTMPVSDGTVGIDVDKGEMLLERNGYYNLDAAGKNYNYTPLTGMRFVPIDPEKGTETDEQKQAIKNLLKEAEYAAASGDRKRVESIFDVESFVNMYICEELMKDIDIYHGSTYFYYKNDHLYSGPIWDMDLSMGNVSVTQSAVDEKYAKYHNVLFNGARLSNGTRNDSTTGNWATVDFYKYLMENMWFRDLVKARYEELIPVIENLYADGGTIDGYIEEFGDAFIRNYELGGYSLTRKYFNCEYDKPIKTYEESITYLKQWLRERDAWIREDLGIE